MEEHTQCLGVGGVKNYKLVIAQKGVRQKKCSVFLTQGTRRSGCNHLIYMIIFLKKAKVRNNT